MFFSYTIGRGLMWQSGKVAKWQSGDVADLRDKMKIRNLFECEIADVERLTSLCVFRQKAIGP